MARKGENIYKRKDGRYEGRYIKGYKENRKPIFGYVYSKVYGDVKKRLLRCKTSFCQGQKSVNCGSNSTFSGDATGLTLLKRTDPVPALGSGHIARLILIGEGGASPSTIDYLAQDTVNEPIGTLKPSTDTTKNNMTIQLSGTYYGSYSTPKPTVPNGAVFQPFAYAVKTPINNTIANIPEKFYSRGYLPLYFFNTQLLQNKNYCFVYYHSKKLPQCYYFFIHFCILLC